MPHTPRSLLEALSSGQPLADFPEDALVRARALAAAPQGAPPAEVEALPEPLALAVLEASVRARTPALAAALASGGSRELARAAKKALYKLRSSGVALPEAPRPAPAPEAPRTPAPEALPAILTAMAGNGDYGLTLARPSQGRLEVVQVLLNDEGGVLELADLAIARGDYRKLLRELRRDAQLPTLELSLEEAGEELARGAHANLASHTPFPTGLERVLRHLGLQPRAPEPLPEPLPGDERLVAAEGHTLHTQPELAGWLPPEPELRVLAERLVQVESSPLALSDVQKVAQVYATVRERAHAFFASQPLRQLYARRLWWMARFFERTERAHLGEVARAEARWLFHGRQEPSSRFAEGLFEKVLKLPGLAPGQLPVAAEARVDEGGAERRTSGGIILP